MRSVSSLKNLILKLISKNFLAKKARSLSYLQILIISLGVTSFISYSWYISHINKIEKSGHDAIKNELSKAFEILKLTSERISNCVSETQIARTLHNVPALGIKNSGLYYIFQGTVYTALGQLQGDNRHLIDTPQGLISYISVHSEYYLSYIEPYSNSRLLLHIDNPILISGTKYFANLKGGPIYIPEFGVYYSYFNQPFYAFIAERYLSLLVIFLAISCLMLQLRVTFYQKYLREKEQKLIEENQTLRALKGKNVYLNRLIWKLRENIESYKETMLAQVVILMGSLEKDYMLFLDETKTTNLTCAIDQTLDGFLTCERAGVINLDEELEKLLIALEFSIKDNQIKFCKEIHKGRIFNKINIVSIILYNVIYAVIQRIPVQGELTISGNFLEGKYVILIKDNGYQYNVDRVAKSYPQRDEGLLLHSSDLKELMLSHNITMQCLTRRKVNTTKLYIQDLEENREDLHSKSSNVIPLFNK